MGALCEIHAVSFSIQSEGKSRVDAPRQRRGRWLELPMTVLMAVSNGFYIRFLVALLRECRRYRNCGYNPAALHTQSQSSKTQIPLSRVR